MLEAKNKTVDFVCLSTPGNEFAHTNDPRYSFLVPVRACI